MLVAGGSTQDPPRGLDDLIRPFEAFDPTTRTFATVPTSGAPVLRALHTAFARTEEGVEVVEMLGGRGNIAFSTANPRYGVRDDVRTFALLRDSLVALTPSTLTGQGLPVEPVEGHATVEVGRGEVRRWRTAGATLLEGEALRQAFGLVQVGDVLRLEAATLPLVGRFRAAAAQGQVGEMWTAGGQTATNGAVAPDGELFSSRAGRAFGVDTIGGRWGAAAYPAANGGLCVVGGFDASGAALADHTCWTR
jgi:hypothetical protein